jgi:hypothetical protein
MDTLLCWVRRIASLCVRVASACASVIGRAALPRRRIVLLRERIACVWPLRVASLGTSVRGCVASLRGRAASQRPRIIASLHRFIVSSSLRRVTVLSRRVASRRIGRRCDAARTLPDRHGEITRAHRITARVKAALLVFRACAGRLLSNA